MTGLGQQHLMRLFVHGEVAWAVFLLDPGELGNDLVHPVIQVGAVVRLAGNDKRCPCLVDQDRVDLVDDRIRQAPLHPLAGLEHHVVAQIVEAELAVGAVGDVGGIGLLLQFVLHLRQIDADAQAQEPVHAPHPLGIAVGKVVVDRDHVHALAGERVEVGWEGSNQRLALAGSHLRNLAVVKRDASEQLNVEVAHVEHAPAGFAHGRKHFRQEIVERFAVLHALPEYIGARAQVGIAQFAQAGLEGVDRLYGVRIFAQQPVVAAAEYFLERIREHSEKLPQSKRGGDACPHPSDKIVLRFVQLGTCRKRAGFCGAPH